MVCWLPFVSHLISFRPAFFPLEIAEATCHSPLLYPLPFYQTWRFPHRRLVGHT